MADHKKADTEQKTAAPNADEKGDRSSNPANSDEKRTDDKGASTSSQKK